MDRKGITSLPLHLQHDARRERQNMQSREDDSVSFNVYDLVPSRESIFQNESIEVTANFRKLGNKQSSFRDIINDSRGFEGNTFGESQFDRSDPFDQGSSKFFEQAHLNVSGDNDKYAHHRWTKPPLSSHSSVRDNAHGTCSKYFQEDSFGSFPDDCDLNQSSVGSFDDFKDEQRPSTRVKKSHIVSGQGSDDVTIFPQDSFERATLFRAFSTKSFNPFGTIDEESSNTIERLDKGANTCEDSISDIFLQNSISGHGSQNDSFDQLEELNHSNESLTRKPPRPRATISSRGKSRSMSRNRPKELDPPLSPHSSTANSTSQNSSSVEDTVVSSCPPSPMTPNAGRRVVHPSPGRRRRHLPHSGVVAKPKANRMKMPDKLLNDHLMRRVMRETMEPANRMNEDPKAEAAAQAALLLESFLKSKLQALAAEKERQAAINTNCNYQEFGDHIPLVNPDKDVQMIAMDKAQGVRTNQAQGPPEEGGFPVNNSTQLQSEHVSRKSERRYQSHESMKEAGKILSLHLAQRKPMPFSRREASSIMPQVGLSRVESEIPESPMTRNGVSAQSPRRTPRVHASASRSRLRQPQSSAVTESPVSPSKRTGSTLRPRRKYSDSTLQVSPKRSSRAISRGSTRLVDHEIPDIFH